MSRRQPIFAPPPLQPPPAYSALIHAGAGGALSPFLAILYSQFIAKTVWLEWFTFSAVWRPLLANASGQLASCTIDPQIDFLALEMNLSAYESANPANVVASPNYLLEVQEKSGNSNWSDGPIHVGNWTGQNRNAGATPYTLPFPRYIRGNNTIALKLTNNTAVEANVDLALPGLRVTYTNTSRERLFGIPF